MTAHEELIAALTAERFGQPTPPPPSHRPIHPTALAALLAELSHEHEEEVA